MKIDPHIKPQQLTKSLEQLFTLAAAKVKRLDRDWDISRGAPVITIEGKYTSRAWTQWTHGFQFGSPLLVFDATGDQSMLKLGRTNTFQQMPPHLTHMGVHDHGFNNVSTYGNLKRLAREKKFKATEADLRECDLALKVSGAVQAARWSGVRADQPPPLSAGATQFGYIYSFNGPHSLFIDTMRSLRSLGVAWQLGQVLLHENDRSADLLKRTVLHALTTCNYLIFRGDSSQAYDVRGRTAHEGIFNRNDGCFRSRATQQGYSPFSTWMRGLAWAMLGLAEQIEFISSLNDAAFKASTGLARRSVLKAFEQTAINACDHYINDCSAADGIPYWDDGAPGLNELKNWRDRPADPFNDHEPVDSSAAAIAAQGLLRLGHFLKNKRYTQAGLTIARTLMDEPYLSTKSSHEGLLLHSVYHRPNGWDHIPRGRKIPCGESSMWGDYHLLELGVLIQRLSEDGSTYPTFFEPGAR